MGLPRLGFGIIGNADIERLALCNERCQRAHGFFERRLRIEAVRIENVDIVEAEALQRLIGRGDEVLAAPPFAIGAFPHVIAGLGRDDQFIAIGLEVARHDLAEELFDRARRGP